ncbi:uncharacterized protein B0I36DRAFT_137164 [Microdochium trichocladiopsis]|uniref:Peptidoglycan-binding domain 1 protein n=1 Tax=Microdochium trichocladiopsis TaxID=1682393 RepID=A0A9P8Y181_9PEZI|nr:uncharacterized protein B0I36DRAFT_137164 [Microdochium trichocladiopsis]KAH7027300.1 hypothetical protein B0I36DRAFT_137164 [Microdochium trichocladiopsis]
MKLNTSIAALATLSVASAATLNPSPRSGTKLTQSQAASRLSAAGITSYSSGGCTDRTNPTCTSYEGVYSGTVDGAVTLKGACGCALVITGGTETGHASGTYSHANGYKFDFRKNTQLDAYVKNSFTRIADRGDGYAQWKSAAGNIYCDEGNHWDVTYY